jgi:hypothetical protein
MLSAACRLVVVTSRFALDNRGSRRRRDRRPRSCARVVCFSAPLHFDGYRAVGLRHLRCPGDDRKAANVGGAHRRLRDGAVGSNLTDR